MVAIIVCEVIDSKIVNKKFTTINERILMHQSFHTHNFLVDFGMLFTPHHLKYQTLTLCYEWILINFESHLEIDLNPQQSHLKLSVFFNFANIH